MIPFYVYNSFTRTPYAGNPAGVFLDTDGLSPDKMRKMAAEVSLESAFVSQDGDGLCLRFFTPAAEVPLCGHATVAAFAALAREGRVPLGQKIPFSCPAGHLSVILEAADEGVVVHMAQAAPVFGPSVRADDFSAIATALGASLDELHPRLPPQVVSTGSAWLFAAVTERSVVDAAPGDLALITRLSREYGALGLYVFALDVRARGTGTPMAYARCFAPAFGLDEDPVTGSASGALGCLLARHGVVTPEEPEFVAEQGVAIGRAGRVTVRPSFDAGGRPDGVEIGGIATLVASGRAVAPG